MKGFYATVHHFIRYQPDPQKPVGTIISVSSGLAGQLVPGASSYSPSKLAMQRVTEYVDIGDNL